MTSRGAVRPAARFALMDKVPRDHHEPDQVFLRRRKVVVVSGLAGSVLLSQSLRSRPGSKEFYRLTTAVAVTWLAGGTAAGPLHLGREHGWDQQLRRPVLTPLVTGVAAFGLFLGGGLVTRRIPVLEEAIASVLDFAEEGSTPLVLATTLANGAAEELFFRGALYAAANEPYQVAVSTAAYAAATFTTGNPALVLAAAVMGTVFGLQRRATGGIQAPLLTHLTWSALMLRYLPPLFRRGRRRQEVLRSL